MLKQSFITSESMEMLSNSELLGIELILLDFCGTICSVMALLCAQYIFLDVNDIKSANIPCIFLFLKRFCTCASNLRFLDVNDTKVMVCFCFWC
jgi:hypothetical protein